MSYFQDSRFKCFYSDLPQTKYCVFFPNVHLIVFPQLAPDLPSDPYAFERWPYKDFEFATSLGTISFVAEHQIHEKMASAASSCSADKWEVFVSTRRHSSQRASPFMLRRMSFFVFHEIVHARSGSVMVVMKWANKFPMACLPRYRGNKKDILSAWKETLLRRMPTCTHKNLSLIGGNNSKRRMPFFRESGVLLREIVPRLVANSNLYRVISRRRKDR